MIPKFDHDTGGDEVPSNELEDGLLPDPRVHAAMTSFPRERDSTPDPPSESGPSPECFLYWFVIVVGATVVLSYSFLFLFWFYVYYRDGRVNNVREGEKHQCTSFPDIFLSFFAIMLILCPFSIFVAWLDPESQCYTLMEFMKCIICTLWLLIMIWGVVEYYAIEPDCQDYMTEVGGKGFWLACETFAYSMIAWFAFMFLVMCFWLIQICERRRAEREFQAEYYRYHEPRER